MIQGLYSEHKGNCFAPEAGKSRTAHNHRNICVDATVTVSHSGKIMKFKMMMLSTDLSAGPVV